MKNEKKSNILIPLGLLVFVIAPSASYMLAPFIIRVYCDMDPSDWCGLGLAPIVYGGIFFAVLLLGAMTILIITAPEKKS
jgi:hypothetical protein